jgi:hypothetical protein
MLKRLREQWDAATFTAGYEAFCAAAYGEAPLPKDIRWLALRLFLRDAYRALVCRVRGHDLHCEGSVGPDSGSERFYCERCGYSDEITYY